MLSIFRPLTVKFAYLALFLSTTGLYAQERVFTLDELFSLADKNSKSIRLHQLVIREAEQGIKVARNAYLPSLSVKAEATYIGDGCMTDRDFSNGVHADMPHWGNSFVVKAQQTLYAGEASKAASGKASCRSRQPNRPTLITGRTCASCWQATTWTCSN